MPFYEYECSACKFYVEALQKISDPPMKKCPSCKKQTLKKLVSAPAFRLAGGGWYETDFKSDKENKRNLVGEEKEASESKTESKTESKPESKESDKASEAKPAAESKTEKPSERTTASSSAKKSKAKSKPKPKPAAKKK
jgi:putative FmdB family regulatory protein